MCGDTECPRCYPGARKQVEATETDREHAIEQVVETLMDIGHYPRSGRKELDLYDILSEERDPSYMLELYIAAMSENYAQGFRYRVEKERKDVAAILWVWLKDTDIIDELAHELANEGEE
tara:strand:+ start:280 stop:639 length:360 start_codon:yes stop_codon:yes gene_type:complete